METAQHTETAAAAVAAARERLADLTGRLQADREAQAADKERRRALRTEEASLNVAGRPAHKVSAEIRKLTDACAARGRRIADLTGAVTEAERELRAAELAERRAVLAAMAPRRLEIARRLDRDLSALQADLEALATVRREMGAAAFAAELDGNHFMHDLAARSWLATWLWPYLRDPPRMPEFRRPLAEIEATICGAFAPTSSDNAQE